MDLPLFMRSGHNLNKINHVSLGVPMDNRSNKMNRAIISILHQPLERLTKARSRPLHLAARLR